MAFDSIPIHSRLRLIEADYELEIKTEQTNELNFRLKTIYIESSSVVVVVSYAYTMMMWENCRGKKEATSQKKKEVVYIYIYIDYIR